MPHSEDEWSEISTPSTPISPTNSTTPAVTTTRNTQPLPQTDDPLKQYFFEQKKLFKHLNKRFQKFNKKFIADGERFKKEVKKDKSVRKQKQKERQDRQIAARKQRQNLVGNQGTTTQSQTMRGTNVVNGMMKRVTSSSSFSTVSSGSSSRTFSSTSSASARPPASGHKRKSKNAVNPDAMSLAEATRVLRAIEISNPHSAYSLTLQTKHTKSSLPLRGRISLPQDPRRVPEVVLVLCSPSEPSYAIAQSSGAHFVGGEELFPKVLSGEIAPTKVLCTPGMLGAVQSQLARYLGPKGLMPVAKRGGVGEGEELGVRIREAKGLMEWRGDKLGVVRAPIARVTFSLPSVEENIKAFISAVKEGSAASTSDTASKTGKKASTILGARLETTNGPSIEINDVL